MPAGPRMIRAPQRITAVPRDAELAFQPVAVLSELVRTRKVTSTQLTEMYLSRIRAHDPVLKAVITVTEERARRQAAQADAEIAAGKYRGPLHGIPWGAKDLLAVKGYQDDVGRGPVPRPGHRRGRGGRAPTRRGRRGAAREALARRARAGRRLVRQRADRRRRERDDAEGAAHAQPVERGAGLERLLGRPRGAAVAAGLVAFAIGRRRSAPSRRRPRATASPACAPPSAACRAPARWRCRGRWTSSVRSAASSRTARWCSTRSTARTAAT